MECGQIKIDRGGKRNAACIVLREACRKTVMCRYLEINVGTDSDSAFQKSLKQPVVMFSKLRKMFPQTPPHMIRNLNKCN